MATPTTLPAAFVSGNVLTAAQLNDVRGAFRVLQVVTADKVDVFTTTSTSYVDVTGWTATITPTSATSKVLVMYSATCSASGGLYSGFNIVRAATSIGRGTASGSRVAANSGVFLGNPERGGSQVTGCFLDSPATTSATIYKMQAVNHSSGQTLTVGATLANDNNVATYSCLTNITLMEISA